MHPPAPRCSVADVEDTSLFFFSGMSLLLFASRIFRMKSFLLVATLSGLGPILTVSASRLPRQSPRDEACSIYKISHAEDCQGFPTSFLVTSSEPPVALLADTQILEDAFAACAVLQDEYFNSDYGTWPSAIDWTAAVVGTHLSAMLTTLTESLGSISLQGVADWAVKENLISSLYAQVVSFFFGQDSLAIRGQVGRPSLTDTIIVTPTDDTPRPTMIFCGSFSAGSRRSSSSRRMNDCIPPSKVTAQENILEV